MPKAKFGLNSRIVRVLSDPLVIFLYEFVTLPGRREPVSDPGFCRDVAFFVPGLNFLAKLSDEDAEIFVLIYALRAPDRTE